MTAGRVDDGTYTLQPLVACGRYEHDRPGENGAQAFVNLVDRPAEHARVLLSPS